MKSKIKYFITSVLILFVFVLIVPIIEVPKPLFADSAADRNSS